MRIIVAVLIVALGTACGTASTPHPWPDLVGRLEDVDRRYAFSTTAAREFERVLKAHGRCPEFVPVMRELGDDLNEERREFQTLLGFAEHVAMTTQDSEALEYLMDIAEIEEDHLASTEGLLFDMGSLGTSHNCWPE